ncbi:MAG TPA: FkbM family methyltransferase [Aliidongia sp.]|nr:FkbM family methyltransferase [Aliidongia sp.]
MPSPLIQHHRIFDKYNLTATFADQWFEYNFVGAKVRLEYDAPLPDGIDFDFMTSGRSYTSKVDPTHPARPSEDYFEWIDLLTAIDAATDRFVMVELGAGYGRWIANAVTAIRRHKTKSNLPYFLVGVEANSDRFAWMKQNLIDNEIDVDKQRLIMAGASDRDGHAYFPAYQSAFPGKQEHSYGNGLYLRFGEEAVETTRKIEADGNVSIMQRVPLLRLETILNGIDRVDLLDLDIQGHETVVIEDSLDLLDRKVARIHVGTHNDDADKRILAALQARGWESIWAFPHLRANETPYGPLEFCDGIFSFRNPKL